MSEGFIFESGTESNTIQTNPIIHDTSNESKYV